MATASYFGGRGYRCLGTTSRRDAVSGDTFFLDLEDIASASALVELIPQIQALIFCTGYEPSRSLSETDRLHHKKMLDIHVTGPLFVVKALQQKIRRGGSVIFISSVAAQNGSYDPSYAIAKAATGGMVRTLARELAPAGIRVNAIAPGLVADTRVYNGMTADFRERHLNQIPLKKLTSVADCAEAIFFLCMQQQINGQTLHLNGGQYFGN